MLLDTTSKLIRFKLGEIHGTGSVDFVSAYADTASGTTFVPGGTSGASNGTTYVTAVAVPALGDQRHVKTLNFYNNDSVAHELIVEHYDGSNGRILVSANIEVGQTAYWSVETGWVFGSGEFQPLDDDLSSIAGLGTTGIAARVASGSWATRSLTQPAAGITIANPAGIAGNPVFALANDLSALEAMAGAGLVARTASETYAQRTIQQPAAGITVANGGGVAGDPTLALANDLAALEAQAGTGIVSRTASETYAQRSLTQPAAGLTITNPAGIAGDPTFALANDLAALEAQSGTGFMSRTASETYAQRTLQQGTGITITNPAGIAGDPTIATTITQYTDEAAQDAVGGILTDTAEIDFTYDDAGNTIKADIKANSVVVGRISFAATARLLGRATASAGAGEEIPLGGALAMSGGTLVTALSATARLLGRTTAGSGVSEEISVGATLSLSALSLGINLANNNTWTGTASWNDGVSTDCVTSIGYGATAFSMVRAGGGQVTYQVQGEGTTTANLSRYSTDATESAFVFNKARGTIASPSVVATSDAIGTLRWRSQGSASFGTNAEYTAFITDPSPSNTARGTVVKLSMCPNGSNTLTEVARWSNESGLQVFGTNTVIDQNRLLRLRVYTVATLPAAGTAGRTAFVSDALAPTFGATVAGAGAVGVPVYDDGTNWKVG